MSEKDVRLGVQGLPKKTCIWVQKERLFMSSFEQMFYVRTALSTWLQNRTGVTVELHPS